MNGSAGITTTSTRGYAPGPNIKMSSLTQVDNLLNPERVPTVQDLASFMLASLSLREIMDLRYFYPSETNTAEIIKIHRKLVEIVESYLELDALKHLKDFYKRPDFDNTPASDEIKLLGGFGFALLLHSTRKVDFDKLSDKERREMHADIVKEAHMQITKELKDVLGELEEQVVFNCRIPHPPDQDFLTKKRMLFLLRKYWELYVKIASYITQANMWYSPNPLSRFVANLKVRCRACLEHLENEEFKDRFLSFFDLSFEELNMGVEHANEEMDRITIELEELSVEIGYATFPLTYAEGRFIYAFTSAFEDLRNRAEEHFSKELKNAERERTKHEPKKPPSAFEYLRKVEITLRELILSKYKQAYGTEWVNEVRAVIGEEKFKLATDTMEQRSVRELDELLHFTQLSDLHVLIKDRWQLFSGSFTYSRKEFNKQMDPILKGRTEEMHNRPAHLWPDEEQQRVRVACFDLLKSIKS